MIDTASLQNIKTIPIKGGIHDLNLTPDGKYVVAGASRGAKAGRRTLMYVIDTKTNEIAWTLANESGPLSDGDIEESRRLYRQDIRSNGGA